MPSLPKGLSINLSTNDNFSAGQVYMLDSFTGDELAAKDFVGFCVFVEVSGTLVIKGGSAVAMLLGMEQQYMARDIEALAVYAGALQTGSQLAAEAAVRVLGLKFSGKAVLKMAGLNSSVGLGMSIIGGMGVIDIDKVTEPDPPEPRKLKTVIEKTIKESTIIFAGDALFDFDKDNIKTTAQARKSGGPVPEEELKKAGEMIKGSAASQVFVTGHTDNVGPDDYNVDLSHRRANNVASWLVARGYVAASKLMVYGMGKKVPRAANTSADGRRTNRRVEIRIFL